MKATRSERYRKSKREKQASKRDDDRYMKNGGLCCLAFILAVIDYMTKIGDKL